MWSELGGRTKVNNGKLRVEKEFKKQKRSRKKAKIRSADGKYDARTNRSSYPDGEHNNDPVTSVTAATATTVANTCPGRTRAADPLTPKVGAPSSHPSGW